MGITAAELARLYPTLFHMASEGSWPSIRRNGLHSTSSLLDLFEISGDERRRIEEEHRPESVTIFHSDHGMAVVRDQKPMSDRSLVRALPLGLCPREWYLLLNSKVFFWLTEERLNRMMGASAYRQLPKTVLHIETAALLEKYGVRVMLTPMNTGCTKPFPHPRGRDTFRTLADYPFDARRSRGQDAIVELAVSGAVLDIADMTIKVEEIHPDGARIALWARD